MDLIHKFEASLNGNLMKNLNYAIVSEEMVWLWYYDQFGGKHFKELLAKEAVNFVKEIGTNQIKAGENELVTEKRDYLEK